MKGVGRTIHRPEKSSCAYQPEKKDLIIPGALGRVLTHTKKVLSSRTKSALD